MLPQEHLFGAFVQTPAPAMDKNSGPGCMISIHYWAAVLATSSEESKSSQYQNWIKLSLPDDLSLSLVSSSLSSVSLSSSASSSSSSSAAAAAAFLSSAAAAFLSSASAAAAAAAAFLSSSSSSQQQQHFCHCHHHRHHHHHHHLQCFKMTKCWVCNPPPFFV